MTKQYMKEFPYFDNGTTFDTLLDQLSPMGFIDVSYKNDVSPSIALLDKEDNQCMTVWVDYKDRALRDWPETIGDIFVQVDDEIVSNFNCDFTSVDDALKFIRMHYMELENV